VDLAINQDEWIPFLAHYDRDGNATLYSNATSISVDISSLDGYNLIPARPFRIGNHQSPSGVFLYNFEGLMSGMLFGTGELDSDQILAARYGNFSTLSPLRAMYFNNQRDSVTGDEFALSGWTISTQWDDAVHAISAGLDDGYKFIDPIYNLVAPKRKFRTLSFNTYLGFQDPLPNAKLTATLNHIKRVDADFITLTEINVADSANIESVLSPLGYKYFEYVSGTYQVMMASKFEITFSEEIVMSGRNPLYCEVSFGELKIGIVSHHNASWCMTGCNTDPSQLPAEPMAHDRMVQLYMTLYYLNNKKASDSTLKGFILQGDWNDDILNNQPTEYTSAPSGGMALPAYLSYPLTYATFPLAQMDYYDGNMEINLSTDLSGSTNTIWENTPNAAFTFPMRMDYIAYSDDIKLIGGEILNSEVDGTTGLKKYGSVLSFGDSRIASDHKAVFADFEIEDNDYYAGGGFLNLFRSYINFNPTDSADSKYDIFDRSNTTIHNAASRASSFYDASRPFTYHMTELTYDVFQSYFNSGYENRVFIKLADDNKSIEWILALKDSQTI
jgi:hypothetical protein